MRILYLGSSTGIFRQHANALQRLGHAVFCLDPLLVIPPIWSVRKWNHDTGGWGFSRLVTARVLQIVQDKTFDLVLVDGGHLVEPELVTSLKRKFGKVINLNFDDPFPLKEYHEYPGWRLYRECIPFYDLLVVVREPNVQEVLQGGAQKVTRVFMTADEVDHCKIHIEAAEQEQWKSAVSFIGTWFPERGPFLAELMDRGIPLSIWGNRWQRAREWNKLKTAWRGPAIYNQDYVKAVQSSQICLGLLSKGNRDLHTTRSLEIPAIGSLLCAERTSEHLQLYNEGTEAIFWSNADECADLCLQLLKTPAQIQKIAAKGHERCLANNHFNLSMMKAILDEALTI